MTIHLGSFLVGLVVGILATLVFAVICGLALNVAALRGGTVPKAQKIPPMPGAEDELERIRRSVERGEWE